MAILHTFDDELARDLAAHSDCDVQISNYADGESVVVECVTHGEILIEFQPKFMANAE